MADLLFLGGDGALGSVPLNFGILLFPRCRGFQVLSSSGICKATRTQSLLYWISSVALLVVNQTYTKMLRCFIILFPRLYILSPFNSRYLESHIIAFFYCHYHIKRDVFLLDGLLFTMLGCGNRKRNMRRNFDGAWCKPSCDFLRFT